MLTRERRRPAMTRIRFREPRRGRDDIHGWNFRTNLARAEHRRQKRVPVYFGTRGRGPYNIKPRPWRPNRRSDPANLGGWRLPWRWRMHFSSPGPKAQMFDLTNPDDCDAMIDTLSHSEAYRIDEWYPLSCDPIRLRAVRRVRDRMADREPEPRYRGWLYDALAGNPVTIQ
jgi:hypothetical protein